MEPVVRELFGSREFGRSRPHEPERLAALRPPVRGVYRFGRGEPGAFGDGPPARVQSGRRIHAQLGWTQYELHDRVGFHDLAVGYAVDDDHLALQPVAVHPQRTRRPRAYRSVLGIGPL